MQVENCDGEPICELEPVSNATIKDYNGYNEIAVYCIEDNTFKKEN